MFIHKPYVCMPFTSCLLLPPLLSFLCFPVHVLCFTPFFLSPCLRLHCHHFFPGLSSTVHPICLRVAEILVNVPRWGIQHPKLLHCSWQWWGGWCVTRETAARGWQWSWLLTQDVKHTWLVPQVWVCERWVCLFALSRVLLPPCWWLLARFQDLPEKCLLVFDRPVIK